MQCNGIIDLTMQVFFTYKPDISDIVQHLLCCFKYVSEKNKKTNVKLKDNVILAFNKQNKRIFLQ